MINQNIHIKFCVKGILCHNSVLLVFFHWSLILNIFSFCVIVSIVQFNKKITHALHLFDLHSWVKLSLKVDQLF